VGKKTTFGICEKRMKSPVDLYILIPGYIFLYLGAVKLFILHRLQNLNLTLSYC